MPPNEKLQDAASCCRFVGEDNQRCGAQRGSNLSEGKVASVDGDIGGDPPEMHSRFLETAAEGGVVGLTAFFALIGLALTAGTRAAAHLVQV